MMKVRGLVLGAAAVVMASLTACGSSVSSSTGAGGQGGDPVTSSTSSTSATTTSSATSTTSATTSAGTGGGMPTVCGGKLGKPCAADEFCDYPDNSCGVFDSTGVCVKRPVTCPDNYQPTCGCDGTVYSNVCDANAAGSDENDNGVCAAPSGMFGCGAHFCALDSEYCEIALSDVGGVPSTYTCRPLPSGCSIPTCGCLANAPCGASCTTTADGGLAVTCAGG